MHRGIWRSVARERGLTFCADRDCKTLKDSSMSLGGHTTPSRSSTSSRPSPQQRTCRDGSGVSSMLLGGRLLSALQTPSKIPSPRTRGSIDGRDSTPLKTMTTRDRRIACERVLCMRELNKRGRFSVAATRMNRARDGFCGAWHRRRRTYSRGEVVRDDVYMSKSLLNDAVASTSLLSDWLRQRARVSVASPQWLSCRWWRRGLFVRRHAWVRLAQLLWCRVRRARGACRLAGDLAQRGRVAVGGRGCVLTAGSSLGATSEELTKRRETKLARACAAVERASGKRRRSLVACDAPEVAATVAWQRCSVANVSNRAS